MTTEQLRKQIHVLEYDLSEEGIKISYVRYTDALELGTKYVLLIKPKKAARRLSDIGSIDSYKEDAFHLFWKGNHYSWEMFVHEFTLSQWEALTLVIRYEYEKELKNDVNLLEMDKTIEALRNS